MAGKEDFYIGKRLSFDGALCTVRYYGDLAGAKGSWLGVEWDETSRGKHDGTHKGQRIFSCLSNYQTAASFVRPSRPADDTRTFLEALRFKYAGKDNAGNLETAVEISGKIVEKVGFEKIRRQQADLQDLRVAVLDELQLCGIGRGPLTPDLLQSAQNEILKTCPNIIELDIGWSLLEKWQDVADICRPLTKLRILKVSGVRLHLFGLAETAASPFAGVQEVHLNETLLRPVQLAEMLNDHFPCLKTLTLAQNNLESLVPSELSRKLFLPTLTILILEKNAFCDFASLVSMFYAFPSLTDLSLQQNYIDKIGNVNLTKIGKLGMFRNLRSLNLSGNKINDFHFVDLLSVLFSNLASLRISSNPLYTTALADTPTARSDVPYSFTVARMPSLTMLNYTIITPRDREEAEIYYISAAGKEIVAVMEEPGDAGDIAQRMEVAKAKYPRYEALCSKYDRDTVFEQYISNPVDAQSKKASQKLPPGSLAARLIEASFYIPASPDKTFHRSIARTIDVYRIKALISRELELRPLQFRLVYESEELDPVRDGLEQNSSDWEAWGDWDVDGEDEHEPAGHESWIDGVLLKDGKKWKKREVEILDGTKAWGDYIGDEEIRAVTVRVEPYGVH